MIDDQKTRPGIGLFFIVCIILTTIISLFFFRSPSYIQYVSEMEKLAWSDASGWDIDEAMKHILNHPRKYDRVISETGHEELLCHILLWEIAKDIHMPQHKITHFEELVKANFGELKLI